MGQRLVVTIESMGKPIAAIYYHWSAYTRSALEETRDIINCIYDSEYITEKELQHRLIRFCEANGGGIRGDNAEVLYVENMFPNEEFKKDGYSRNNGLIAISHNGIADLRGWSEGDVFIDIDDGKVCFCVYSGYESIDEYVEDRKSWDDDFDENDLDNIPKFNFDLGTFDINDIDGIISDLNSTNEYIVMCNGEVCEFIE